MIPSALLLSILLSPAPAPDRGPPDAGQALDRAAAALERLECLEDALRRLDLAELQVSQARTRGGRARAGRGWFEARLHLARCRGM